MDSFDQGQGQALPFITYEKGRGFALSKEAESFLKSLKDEQLGVISIAGKYRTGKSFFVNRVLLNKKKQGFSVGPTVNPCTKGLWLWSQTLQSENPEHPDMKVLLIDTEGFAGLDESATHDTRIFIFSLLLSSFFIYNSVGTIDESALNNLTLIINLAKEIQMKSEEAGSSDEKEDLVQYFPSFLWIVRDFALKLIDTNGHPISSKDYLENALRVQKGISDNVESKNRIRRMFTHFFRDRDCSTMVRPLENEKELQKLDEVHDTEMRAEFVEQMTGIRKKIFRKMKPKSLNGQCLNGGMFLEITKAYIEAINTGKSPNIENAWTYMCKQESYKALEESINLADEKLRRESKDSAPMGDEDLKELKRQIKEDITNNFKKKSLGDPEDLKALSHEIEAKFEERFAKFISANNEKWKLAYSGWIEKNCALESRLQAEEYKNFYHFKDDLAKAKDLFDREVPQGPNKEQFWCEYSQRIVLMGSEAIAKRTEEQYTMQNTRLTQKLEMTENELNMRRREFETERNNLYDRIQTIEKEKALFKAQENNIVEKMNNYQREKERYEQLYNKTRDDARKQEEKLVAENRERVSDLENKLDRVRTENSTKMNDLEKRNALLEQESHFIKRDEAFFKGKVDLLEQQKEKLQKDLREKEIDLEESKRKLNEVEMLRTKEVSGLKIELEKMSRDLQVEEGRRKETLKLQSDWIVDKSQLESQVQFFKSQLEENKRLHDALLLALEQGLTANDHDGTNELVETNKNLSAAVDNMEMRCKILEEKNEKLKRYKKIVQNSHALQCISCMKLISATIFLNHISGCSTSHQNNERMKLQEQSISPIPRINEQQQLRNETNIDPSSLQISIHQTIVKEGSDSKPYTEYMIQVQYNGSQWSVSRKYKSFCELHQSLNMQFPSLKFPESAFTVLGGLQNLTGSKRPTVIEERRKALQQYLRDLAKLDIVRNSGHFKRFIELDKALDNEANNNGNQSISTGSLNPTERQMMMENLSEYNSSYNSKYTSNNKEGYASGLGGQDGLQNSDLNVPRVMSLSRRPSGYVGEIREEVKNKENEKPTRMRKPEDIGSYYQYNSRGYGEDREAAELENNNNITNGFEMRKHQETPTPSNATQQETTIKLTLQQRSINTAHNRPASFSYQPSNTPSTNKVGYTPPSKLFQPMPNSTYKVLLNPTRTRDSSMNSFVPNEVTSAQNIYSKYHILEPRG